MTSSSSPSFSGRSPPSTLFDQNNEVIGDSIGKRVKGTGGGSDEMLIRLDSSTHVASLTKKFEQLFLNEIMVDVTLVTEEGRFIHAHKIVLASGSQYFKNVIEAAAKAPNGQSSSAPLIICMSDIKYVHLYPLIKYVYTGRVDIPQSDLKPLVKTAFHLKISGLYEEKEHNGQGQLNLNSSDDEESGVANKFSSDEHEEGEVSIKEEMEDFDMEESDLQDMHSFLATEQHAHTSQPSGKGRSSSKAHATNSVPGWSAIDDPVQLLEQGQSSSTGFMNSDYNGAIERDESSFPYQCLECGKRYTCNKSLWRHKRYNCQAVDGKIKFVCKICCKAFCRSDNLKRHTLVAHSVTNS